MKSAVRARITTSTTTTLVAESRYVSQIVISIASAGTGWKLRIQDKSSPAFVLVPETTLAAPTTPTAVIINFEQPILMNGGVDVVTSSGTPGEVTVWVNFGESK